MLKPAFIYGSIAGLIVMPMLIILVTQDLGNHDGNLSMLIGYVSMLLAFTMVFFGVRSYKKNQLGGTISFWRALALGSLIAFIGSTIYVIAWVILSKLFYPNFADDYIQAMIRGMEKSGLTGADLEKKKAELMKQMAFYKTMPGLIMFTYFEILTVGIPVAIISAIIHSIKRKKKDTDTQVA